MSWIETDKIDILCRAHAQRHVTGAQTLLSVTKTSKSSYTKGTMIWKYLQEGTCKFLTHHKTAGQFYIAARPVIDHFQLLTRNKYLAFLGHMTCISNLPIGESTVNNFCNIISQNLQKDEVKAGMKF